MKSLKTKILQLPVILLGLLAISFQSCELFEEEDTTEGTGQILATVGERNLYTSELQSVLPDNISKEDSSIRANEFLQNWIEDQLLIATADSTGTIDHDEIQRRADRYRDQLVLYELELNYINSKLEREVSNSEVVTYYDENKETFILSNNIIKGYYIKVLKTAPDVNKLRSILKKDNNSDYEELKNYCFQNAENYMLNDSSWVYFNDIVRNMPTMNIQSQQNFIKSNKLVEKQDSLAHYFMCIKEYKLAGELSPVEFARKEIEDIIINKRREQLLRNLKRDIYERAQKNGSFEKY